MKKGENFDNQMVVQKTTATLKKYYNINFDDFVNVAKSKGKDAALISFQKEFRKQIIIKHQLSQDYFKNHEILGNVASDDQLTVAPLLITSQYVETLQSAQGTDIANQCKFISDALNNVAAELNENSSDPSPISEAAAKAAAGTLLAAGIISVGLPVALVTGALVVACTAGMSLGFALPLILGALTLGPIGLLVLGLGLILIAIALFLAFKITREFQGLFVNATSMNFYVNGFPSGVTGGTGTWLGYAYGIYMDEGKMINFPSVQGSSVNPGANQIALPAMQTIPDGNGSSFNVYSMGYYFCERNSPSVHGVSCMITFSAWEIYNQYEVNFMIGQGKHSDDPGVAVKMDYWGAYSTDQESYFTNLWNNRSITSNSEKENCGTAVISMDSTELGERTTIAIISKPS